MVLPWLNPFAPGPTPSVGPLLFSWLCIAVLAVLWALRARAAFTDQPGRCIAGAWLWAALLSCLIGLLQYFGQTQAFGQWVSSTGMGEAFGNLRQRNQFATLTSLGLLALLWHVAQWRPAGVERMAPPAYWLLWLAVAVLLALGNAASGSRTGLMQWGLVILLLAIWRTRTQGRVLAVGLFALALYLAAVRGLPWLLETTTGFRATGLLGRLQEDVGCSSRRVLWANVLHLVTQKPWLGWGWGELDFAHLATLYPGERFCDILDNAHNLPLHLAVELGVPLAVLACAALVWLVWAAKPWRAVGATRQLAWGVLAVIALHSLVEYPLWYGPFQMAVGLSVWLLWREARAGVPDDHSSAEHGLALVFIGVIASMFIAFLGFVTWDYRRVSQLYLAPESRVEAYREGTLEKVRGSSLFRDQVEFAELTTTRLGPENAEYLNAMARRLVHFSPEPRVVQKLIDSAAMLGDVEEARFYAERYKVAFPLSYADWMRESGRDETP